MKKWIFRGCLLWITLFLFISGIIYWKYRQLKGFEDRSPEEKKYFALKLLNFQTPKDFELKFAGNLLGNTRIVWTHKACNILFESVNPFSTAKQFINTFKEKRGIETQAILDDITRYPQNERLPLQIVNDLQEYRSITVRKFGQRENSVQTVYFSYFTGIMDNGQKKKGVYAQINKKEKKESFLVLIKDSGRYEKLITEFLQNLSLK
ncbi:hypothetical protein ACFL35_01160 [Candidatus Riflebacteria bacterium]